MFKQFAVAAALVIASSSALGGVTPKFYVGADLSAFKAEGADHKHGYGAFAGYKFNPNFAVEAGYHRLAKLAFGYQFSDADYSFEARSNTKLYQGDISIIGTLPLSNDFSIYGRLGVNHLKSKGTGFITENGVTETMSGSASFTRALYGAGLSYAFSPALAARLEVQRPMNHMTTVAVGVSYGF